MKKYYIEDYCTDDIKVCSKCGSTKVMEASLEESSPIKVIHICDDCKYIEELNSYQDLTAQTEGVNDHKNCYIGYKQYILIKENLDGKSIRITK